MSLFTNWNLAPRAGNQTGSSRFVRLSADSSECLSCIPEIIAGTKTTRRGDHFDTKCNVLGASFASKIEV